MRSGNVSKNLREVRINYAGILRKHRLERSKSNCKDPEMEKVLG